MQLEELKNDVNNTIKKIITATKKKKKKSLTGIIVLVSSVVFVAIVLVLIFLNANNLFFFIRVSAFDTEKNPLFKLAEDAYLKGFFDNSASYYQNYLKQDTTNIEKYLAYKRLFEIAILKQNFSHALSYLDKLEAINSNSPETYLHRIRIYLKVRDYKKALTHINGIRRKYKKLVEYRRLTSIYFLQTGDIKKAHKFLKKIPFGKRTFNDHKKLLHCLLDLEFYDDAYQYLTKIEKKIYILENAQYTSDYLIYKSITGLMADKLDLLVEHLKQAKNLSQKNLDVVVPLLIISGIYVDDYESIVELLKEVEGEYVFRSSFIKIIVDYLLFKKDYTTALVYYEKLAETKKLNLDDYLYLIDLYYRNQIHDKAVKAIKHIFQHYDYKTALLYKNLSFLYNAQKDYRNTLFFLMEGNERFPSDLEFYLYLGKYYFDRNDYDVALEYINSGRMIADKNGELYDSRIDMLYLAIITRSGRITERDLLMLREKDDADVFYYFNLINYYLAEHKFHEAQRELDTVKHTPMDEHQKQFINFYELLIALNKEDYVSFSEFKDVIYMSEDTLNGKEKINLALILMIDNEFNKSNNVLESIGLNAIPEGYNNLLLYFQSVNYYYQNRLNIALSLLNEIIEDDPLFNRASYLRNLILSSLESNIE